MLNTKENHDINLLENKYCIACGKNGYIIYNKLTDRLFGCSGEWSIKKCNDPRCGCLWLDPIPCEKDIVKLYNSYYTHSYYTHSKINIRRSPESFLKYILKKIWKLYLVTMPSYWEKKRLTFMYLNKENPRKLLEIGCGNGERLAKFREAGWQVTGYEIDEIAASVARKRYGIKIYTGDINTIAQEEMFDAIIMNHVIEHVFRPVELIERCRNFLKHNGILVIVTPNSNSIGHKIFRRYWRDLDPPRHLHIFSNYSLLTITHKAGFYKCRTWTTSANALIISAASFDLFKRGRHNMNVNLKIDSLVVGIFFQFLASISSFLYKNLGEECVIVVKK